MGREKEQGERKKCERVGMGRGGKRQTLERQREEAERKGDVLGAGVVWFGKPMVEGIRTSFIESERGRTIARELRRDSEGKTDKPVTGAKEKLLKRCQKTRWMRNQ